MESLNKFKIVENIDEHLRQIEWNNELAVATSIERVRRLRYQFGLNVHCFNYLNNIYAYPLKFLASEHFLYLNELNRFIQHASDGGLIVKWLENVEQFSEKRSLYTYSEVHLESLYGVGILFFILIFAFLVLILEKVVKKKVQIQNANQMWRYIEMAIDPYRHFLLSDLHLN